MNKTTMMLVLLISVGFIFALNDCISAATNYRNELLAIPEEINSENTYIPLYTVESATKKEKAYLNDEIEAIAMTLAGECYDDKPADKRRVAEVIVNRVSDGRFGGSIIEVIAAKGQFYGYWNQSRPVSESDIQIAEEILNDWHTNDYKALSEYLFFCAGPNRENVFRVDY